MRTNPLDQPRTKRLWLAVALLSIAAGAVTSYGQYVASNVVRPGDPVIASSSNSPGSEGVANAIDGTQAKYLNFDTATDSVPPLIPSGFIVTPSVGVTWLTGITIQSANDAPERDPKHFTIEGSNDDPSTLTNWTSGTWTTIADMTIPAFAARFQSQTFNFTNYAAFRSYRWTVLQTATDNDCCMQVAEVQLLGTTLPKNALQPSDQIFASSANSPGSEGVANAIDGTQAKYLNFDTATDSVPPLIPSGFAVTPSVGATLINGIVIQSANDAPERDPKSITIEGSNDDTITGFSGGNWTLIYANTDVPTSATRFQSQTLLFPNVTPYKHYRWTVLKTATDNDCCMQVSEVQLLGSGAPQNVVVPSDRVIASSANSPGSEGVANAIDGTQAKYLNFDTATDSVPPLIPSGFVVTPSVGATVVVGLGIQSANDAPERDPKHVTLEGSNDDDITSFSGGNWTLVADLQVPAFASRFQWQYLYFPSSVAYKHYRWTVLQTTTDNDCCMQVAEVQLLAVTAENDCGKAAFVLQPEETPVLSGAQATFFTAVNGPWTIQWLTNGVPVPGAGGVSFTGPTVTAANQDILYSVAIVGCQTSTPVKAVLFTPSNIKSIGIQFTGGDANGSGVQGFPNSAMTPDLIAGVMPQAYFNVVTNDLANAGGSGDTITMADTLLDSDGNTSAITFEYTTSGAWGAGVGTDTPTQRMLNGIAGAINAAAGDQFMTFHNVPAGTHSLLVYIVAPPLHFKTVGYTIASPSSGVTNYVATMNSDQYKPAPGFYRATSTDPSNPTLADFIRFDNITLAAAGDVTLQFNVIGGSGDRETGVSAMQLLLNSPAAGAPPSITQQPQSVFGPENGTVRLTVGATGDALTYQWRKNGFNLQDGGHISGARSATLTVGPLSADDEAVYSVAVFSAAGSTVSKNASVRISKYDIKDALVGYWKLDETTGTSAANSAANGQPAAISGTAAWGAGKVANALTFDGGSTYGFVNNYTKAKTGIAGSAWVNIPSATAATSMAIMRNADGGISVTDGQFELGLVMDANSVLVPTVTVVFGPNIVTVTGTAAFPLNGWHQIAFSADGAQLRLYVDGQEVASGDYLGEVNTTSLAWLSIGARLANDTTADPPVIGPDATPDFLAGRLDELALWSRALPVDEVRKIYEAGAAGSALDTVVLTPPAGAPALSFARTATGMTITYEGTLQSTDVIGGTWSNVQGATSPYTVTPADAQRYYRSAR